MLPLKIGESVFASNDDSSIFPDFNLCGYISIKYYIMGTIEKHRLVREIFKVKFETSDLYKQLFGQCCGKYCFKIEVKEILFQCGDTEKLLKFFQVVLFDQILLEYHLNRFEIRSEISIGFP